MYCIIVKTELKTGTREKFLAAMLDNAAASVREESGCIVFDVLEDRENADTFYLYEIYQDPGALKAHKDTSHYQSSRAIVSDLIERQSVIRCDVLAVNPPRQT